MRINNGGPATDLESIVLFPFDSHSIPFQHGMQLHLQTRQTGRGNPVVPLGEPGAHDSEWIAYYGTVLRIDGELWMWYLGQGPDEEWHQRVCLAKSKDGRNWQKPDLCLVEYHGSKHNNLVDMGEDMHVQTCVIFHEPDDPDPEKRFKMAFESRKHSSCLGAAYSTDGLTWRESSKNPVAGWFFEAAGGTKLDGCYYLTGQGGKHAKGFRQLATAASYDFENWADATCRGLRRSDLTPKPVAAGKNTGEQVHLGAALWNRGNVIIGFFGKWNGHPSNDRRMLTMDLGFAVSNDALHYSEPIPGFPIVSAAEDSWSVKRRASLALNFPALIQGQGFENVGEETLYWYAPWPEEASDGVRVTSWPRDRLGYFSPYESGIWVYGGKPDAHFVSAPIDLEGSAARLTVNVEGINEHSAITVEIQDHTFRPIPGYDRGASQGPVGSGLAQPITWQGHDVIDGVTGPIRVRVDFGGVRPEDVRLYAVYLNLA